MPPDADRYERMWREAERHFGEQCLAYVLGLPSGATPLIDDKRRWAVVHKLSNIDATMGPFKDSAHIQRTLASLLSSLDGRSKTVVEHLRLIATGSLPEFRSDDAVLNEFVRVGFSALAVQFMEGAEHAHSLMWAALGKTHPFNLLSAFLSDDALTKFFPNVPVNIDKDGMWNEGVYHVWMHGSSPFRAPIFMQEIVIQTFGQMRLDDRLAEDHLVTYFTKSLNDLRRLARGESVDIRLFTPIRGVTASSDFVGEKRGLVSPRRVAMRIGDKDGSAPDSLMYVTTEQRLLGVHVIPLGVVPQWGPGVDEILMQADADESASQLLDELRFLTIAASRITGRTAAPKVFSTSNSIFGTPRHGILEEDERTVDPQELGSHEMGKLRALSEATPTIPNQLRIGVGRIIRAVVEREDRLDSMIDAVFAWENMMGARSETVFRVCGAMSLVLEPHNQQARYKLFKDLKRTYGVRSRAVHGGEPPTANELHEHQTRAVNAAISAMETVLGDENLRNLETSESRSDTLLIKQMMPPAAV